MIFLKEIVCGILASVIWTGCKSRNGQDSDGGDEAQGIRGTHTQYLEYNFWAYFNLKSVSAGSPKVCMWVAPRTGYFTAQSGNSTDNKTIFLDSGEQISPYYIRYEDFKNYVINNLASGKPYGKKFIEMMDFDLSRQKEFGVKSTIENVNVPTEVVQSTGFFGGLSSKQKIDEVTSQDFFRMIMIMKSQELNGIKDGAITKEKCPNKENIVER